MAKYYYKRYAGKPQYSQSTEKSYFHSSYDFLPYGDVYKPDITNPSLESSMIYYSLYCNVNTGYYSNQQLLSESYYLSSGTMYLLICSATEAWSIIGNGYAIVSAHDLSNGVKLLRQYVITPTYIAGEFVDEIIAEDGAYPNDGYNESDGYYYVKDRMAIQFFAQIGGAWVETQPRARIGGAWTEVEIHPRVGGAWVG